jgi:hypothetical protein
VSAQGGADEPWRRAGARGGTWRVHGTRELFEGVRAELEASADAHGSTHNSARGPRALGSQTAYFKGSRLGPGPSLRHALRRALGGEIPRLQEFENLAWLRARGFLAPRPLLAGVLARGGRPRYQFLFSEFVPDAPDLAAFLPRAAPEARATILTALARDLAGLHALGFVHHDLFPRNLLACRTETGARCAFLDAWSAPPGRARRGPEHDLACLFLEGMLSAAETALVLDVYGEERARLGQTLPPSWPERLRNASAAVHRRESRRRSGLPSAWEAPPP